MPFEARPADVAELETGPAADVAAGNAARKARAVAAAVPERRVLGADTVVALGDRLYGKPVNAADARAMLAALAGREHRVLTGVCVIEPGGRERAVTAVTRVRFRPADPALLDWYLAGGEWQGRAGGYAIQGRGAALVAAIDGDYFNVVGLPVPALLDLVPDLLGAGAAAPRDASGAADIVAP